MALSKETFLYEILVRFGPEGYRGAHVVDLELVTDGDEILAGKELPARPITKAEIGGILGQTNAKLIEAADTARSERDKVAADLETANHGLMLANGRADKAEGGLAASQEKNTRLEERAAKSEQRVAELEQRVAAAEETAAELSREASNRTPE